MKIAAGLGLLSAAGYLALAPVEPPPGMPLPADAPVSTAPGVRLSEPGVREGGGGRSVAPPLETTLPDELL